MEGSRPGDRVTEASQPVTRGMHEGQHQMFPQLPPREPPSLNEVAVQRASARTLHCWQQNSAVAGGRKTLSTCSRSTISATYKPVHPQMLNVEKSCKYNYLCVLCCTSWLISSIVAMWEYQRHPGQCVF